jgi:glyoxylase-like metal-dependent hydrolase (beta-lactamase superfamily II)/8-oxo-dGTP pyrophosphatase MutT (NUDIX family)
VEGAYHEARRLLGGAPARPSAPRRAGAVLLWRRNATGDMEVFLVQRAFELSFLGGFWSLPGGAAEAGETASDAARRELAEETGIELDPGAELLPLGHWTTPSISPIRFETAYFAVRCPTGAHPDASASGGELIDGRWVTATEALARFSGGDWLIPSPVARVLSLVQGGGLAAAAAGAHAAAAEDVAARRWPLAAGISVVPLRTPTLPPATHTNCYLVGAGELVLIDPATPYGDEQGAIDRVLDEAIAAGERPVAIWLTHHHLDHVGDVARLAARHRIPVAAHAVTRALLAGRVDVDVELADGDRLELAGDPPRSLRVVFTPGHAPGHLCFFEEATGFLVAGDMVAGIGTILVDPDEGDMTAYLASLARMRELGPRRLLPAHGPLLADPGAALDRYIAHRLWREARVRAALAAGPRAPAALVPEVYADVAPALYPLAERSLRAHLLKLEADGVARRSGEGWQLAAV